jgi:hypothetical protein
MRVYKKESYIRAKGVESPYYKADLTATVLDLINSGYSSPYIGKKLGLSRERIRQLYVRATGKSINQVRREQKLNKVKTEVKRLRQERQLICKGCGITFLSNRGGRLFHNKRCSINYYTRNQTLTRPYLIKAHIEVLYKKKAEIEREIKDLESRLIKN